MGFVFHRNNQKMKLCEIRGKAHFNRAYIPAFHHQETLLILEFSTRRQ